MYIKLSKDAQVQSIDRIKYFFEIERSEVIGEIAAQQMLDYILKEIGPYIYNQAIGDAKTMIEQKVMAIEEELYTLEIPIKVDRK